MKYPIKGQQWPSQTTPANKYEAVCQELVALFWSCWLARSYRLPQTLHAIPNVLGDPPE